MINHKKKTNFMELKTFKRLVKLKEDFLGGVPEKPTTEYQYK